MNEPIDTSEFVQNRCFLFLIFLKEKRKKKKVYGGTESFFGWEDVIKT